MLSIYGSLALALLASSTAATPPPRVSVQEGRPYLRLDARAAAVRDSSPPAPTKLIVAFRGGDKAARFLPGTSSSRALSGGPRAFVVTPPRGWTVDEAVRAYAARADVLYAEPDCPIQLAAVPNDPRWGEQWNMTKVGAPAAWDTQTNSSDVVVAVVDTGIDLTHPDLQANVWTDPLDGSHGFSCVGGVVTPGGQDDNGHGTHVAGVIGAAGDNGLGVAGLDWSVQLLPLKILDASGTGTISDVVLCLDKMVELRQRGINIRVSNNSWATAAYSQALDDAVGRATAAGVLMVAAAGNDGLDLDFEPSYPAAFDHRGVLAVSATDAADSPPFFSNFGHATVDLAAPGVSVLSTVPAGPCTNCDPSGYRLLSGTSMATPHVTGVAAALFHLNPALTAEEARDLLLDPTSFDALSTPSIRASSTTRGRLSFSRAIASPLVGAPALDSFPQLTVPAVIPKAAGAQVTLDAIATDADGDTLRYQWGKPLHTYLLGNMMRDLFAPGPGYPSVVTTDPYVFTVPSPAMAITNEYRALVNDGRGGSAAGRTWLTVQANPTPGQPPSGTLTATPASGPVGTTVHLTYTGSDPEGGSILWGYNGGAGGICCYPATTSFDVTLAAPGVYRINAQSIDREFQLSALSSTVVRIGGAVGEPPIAQLTLTPTSGTAPLTVTYDATASSDPDGSPLTFFPECEAGTQGIIPAGPPTGTCTFEEPGPHAINMYVSDGSASDVRIAYLMVHPVVPPDVTPPTAQVTSPAAGAALTGSVSVQAAAADDVAVDRVELYRDGGVLLGVDTTSPYAATWDTASAGPGAHTLRAKAYDAAGNVGTSPDVAVTVRDLTPPTVALTSPSAGASLVGTVSVNANAGDNVGVMRVDFYRDASVLLGTDTTAPYGIAWNTTVESVGSHTLFAKAYDAENVTTSATVPVTVLDGAAPAVSITSPPNGSTVPKKSNVTVAMAASDNVGVNRVELRVNGTLLCTDTTAPYSCVWATPKQAGVVSSLQAKAYDAAGNSTSSAVAQVTTQ